MIYSEALDDEDRLVDEKLFKMVYGDVIERLIERRDAIRAGVPETFVPSATRFALTDGDYLFYLACPRCLYDTRRWVWNGRTRDGLFYTASADDFLFSVRRYNDPSVDRRQMWAIERKFFMKETIQEVLALDTMPILCTDPKTAKWLAQGCHPNAREQVQYLRWIPMQK